MNGKFPRILHPLKARFFMDWYNVLKQVNDGYGSARSMQGGSDSVSKLGGIISLIGALFG